MPKGRLEGDSGQVTLRPTGGPYTLAVLMGGYYPSGGVRARAFTIRAPQANSASIWVGPNKTARFEVPPGSAHTLENVTPEWVAFDSLGVSGLVATWDYGGECEQDSDQR